MFSEIISDFWYLICAMILVGVLTCRINGFEAVRDGWILLPLGILFVLGVYQARQETWFDGHTYWEWSLAVPIWGLGLVAMLVGCLWHLAVADYRKQHNL